MSCLAIFAPNCWQLAVWAWHRQIGKTEKCANIDRKVTDALTTMASQVHDDSVTFALLWANPVLTEVIPAKKDLR